MKAQNSSHLLQIQGEQLLNNTEGSFKHITHTQNGHFALVGTVVSNTQRLDVRFAIADTEGKIVKDTTIVGGNDDDIANSVISTLDGGYLTIGATKSKRKGSIGKCDGWIVKTDENGTPLWDAVFGSLEDDVFRDGIEDDEGNFYITGERNNQLWFIKLDNYGDFVFEKTLGTAACGNALVRDCSGKIAVTGFDTEGGVIVCFDTEGKLLWQNHLPNAAGNDIIKDHEGHFVAVGTSYKRASLNDFLLIKTDTSGNVLFQKTYTGKGLGEDKAYAVVEDFNHHLYLVGQTKSYPKGSRRWQTWVIVTDSIGQELSRFLHNTPQDNMLNDALLTYEGHLVAVGENNKTAWYLDLGEVSQPLKTFDSTSYSSLIVTNTQLIDVDGVLMPDKERSYYEFYIQNKGTIPIYNLIAEVSQTGQASNFIWKNKDIHIGFFQAGEKRKVSIPLSIHAEATHFETDIMVSYAVKFKATQNILSPKWTFDVLCRPTPHAEITLLKHQFLTEVSNDLKMNKVITLRIDVENKGEQAIKGLRTFFTLPTNVHPLSQTFASLPVFTEQSQQVLTFDFKVDEVFQDSIVSIGFALRNDAGEVNINTNFDMPLPSFFVPQIVPSATVSKNKETYLTWLTTHRDERIVTEKELYRLQIKAVSPDDIYQNGFALRIFNNGVWRSIQNKTGRVKLKNIEGVNTFTFEKDIVLSAGENKIVAEITHKEGKAISDTLTVYYKYSKPNLYILAIGVPLPDLAFSTKDATDFSSLFKNQKGLLFENIIIKTKNTVEDTRQDALRRAFFDIQNDFSRHHLLKESDVVMVYISSHGFTNTENSYFKIAASDYDDLYRGVTTLDFERDIVEVLTPIRCKKVFFIDACYSGSIARNINQAGTKSLQDPPNWQSAIDRILKTQTGLSCLLSSQANEYSYEDAVWQNSAFTKALIEAFSDEKIKPLNCDKDGDRVLTLGEMTEFVIGRVPPLVQAIKKAKQMPMITPPQYPKDLPLFILQNKYP